MKDWYCPYQFDKRFAEESKNCPHRSAEKEDGAILTNNYGEVYSRSYNTEWNSPIGCCSWSEVACYACHANDEAYCEITTKRNKAIAECVEWCRERVKDVNRRLYCRELENAKNYMYYRCGFGDLVVPEQFAEFVSKKEFCEIITNVDFEEAMKRKYGSWENYLQWREAQADGRTIRDSKH